MSSRRRKSYPATLNMHSHTPAVRHCISRLGAKTWRKCRAGRRVLQTGGTRAAACAHRAGGEEKGGDRDGLGGKYALQRCAWRAVGASINSSVAVGEQSSSPASVLSSVRWCRRTSSCTSPGVSWPMASWTSRLEEAGCTSVYSE